MKYIQSKQQGIAILEALIAMLIFSMGILALVGMQATTINNVADAKYRSTAGFFADQIVGTIWATHQINTLAAASGVIAYSPDMSFACSPCSTGGNAYTAAWWTQLNAALPGATASIAIVPPQVTVTINWTPPNATTPHNQTVYTYIN